jgi:hypothetical protein
MLGTLEVRAGSGEVLEVGGASPVVRWGFRLFGRWTQRRFYQAIQRRQRSLVQAAQRGAPLPSPAIRADGLITAPSGVRPHPLERLARSWLHPGR